MSPIFHDDVFKFIRILKNGALISGPYSEWFRKECLDLFVKFLLPEFISHGLCKMNKQIELLLNKTAIYYRWYNYDLFRLNRKCFLHLQQCHLKYNFESFRFEFDESWNVGNTGGIRWKIVTYCGPCSPVSGQSVYYLLG